MFFEEFQIGDRFELNSITLTEDEIFHFANEFDAQPIHVDPQFAEQTIYKGIIASGFHTISAIWGQWVRENKIGTEIIGGTGLDFVKWLYPVKPNDQLHTVVEVIEKKASSITGRGTIVLKFTVTNQHEKDVLETQARVIIKSLTSAVESI